MEIEWLESDPVSVIKKANLITLGRKIDKVKEADEDWYIHTVLSEDSTLEWVHLKITDTVRSDVVNQLVRTTTYHPRHVVESFRPDWTGKDRPKDSASLRLYSSLWTPKALIHMARDRLCYKAMKETRDKVFEIKDYLSSDSTFMEYIGMAMVPHCIYRYGCPFKKSCGYFNRFLEDRKKCGFDSDPFNIIDRYLTYDMVRPLLYEK